MILDFLFGITLFAIATGCASALHGTDTVPKWAAILFHLVCGLAAGLFTPLAVVVFWCFFRNGEQARAELDYAGKDVKHLATGGTLEKIEAVYPPVIGKMMAKIMEYVQTHPWPYLSDKPSRVQQEFSGSAALGAVFFPFIFILEVVL